MLYLATGMNVELNKVKFGPNYVGTIRVRARSGPVVICHLLGSFDFALPLNEVTAILFFKESTIDNTTNKIKMWRINEIRLTLQVRSWVYSVRA